MKPEITMQDSSITYYQLVFLQFRNETRFYSNPYGIVFPRFPVV